MKNLLNTLLFLTGFLISNQVQAQEFKSAIGLRLGYPTSVSFKTFINESNAIEVYAGTRGFDGAFNTGYRWWIVSAGYQIHKPLDVGGLDGLSYYYGAGASVFFWTFDDGFSDDFDSTTFGIQGYAGLNYSFPDTPINVTLDWVPTYFFNGFSNGFGAGFGTLGIRYIISR